MRAGFRERSAVSQREPVAGLFVGLTTLDTVYRVERIPRSDEKVVAQEFFVGAGGPATNAAVTFRHLGGRARLVSAVGDGPIADIVRSDLAELGVDHNDISPPGGTVPVSAVLVTAATGERAVISAHRVESGQPSDPSSSHDVRVAGMIDDVQVVLLDGHRLNVAYDVISGRDVVMDRDVVMGRGIVTSRTGGRPPIVLDGGSWKDGTEKILPLVDVVVCSASFRPPGISNRGDVLRYLVESGPSFAAMTDGSRPIGWVSPDGSGSVTPPVVKVRDTLGAGDVFHGAFAWEIARTGVSTERCVTALRVASRLAATSVEYFGPRSWMNAPSSR